MKPGIAHIDITRGNTVALQWRFSTETDGVRTITDLTGAVAALVISDVLVDDVTDGNALITKTTPVSDLVIDLAAGTVTWTPSLTDSRKIPRGTKSSYELEVRAAGGEQRTSIMGNIAGWGGRVSD